MDRVPSLLVGTASGFSFSLKLKQCKGRFDNDVVQFQAAFGRVRPPELT